MRLVTSTPAQPAERAERPRLHFAHIPKTAGITMKAYFESNFPEGDSIVLEEEAAGTVTRDTLLCHHFISSHYSYEIRQALGERPDVTAMLVREPMSRYQSWLEHGRRSSMPEYRQTCDQGSALDVLKAPDSYGARQAHWLVRSFEQGAEYKAVPSIDQLNALLNYVDIPGTVEDIERFKQLVSFRMGWAPPANGWKFNGAPREAVTSAQREIGEEYAAIKEQLAVDFALYEMVQQRFWAAYADMLSALRPDAVPFTPESARNVPIELAQDWLLHRFMAMVAVTEEPTERFVLTASQPVSGTGWWWRNAHDGQSWAWSGPERTSTLILPKLKGGQAYELTIDFMGAANWQVWEGSTADVNGRPVAVVRERTSRTSPSSCTCRMHIHLTPADVARQGDATSVTLTVPQTVQLFAHVVNEDSRDTFNRDTRAVGLAFNKLTVRRSTRAAAPVLTLRPGTTSAAA